MPARCVGSKVCLSTPKLCSGEANDFATGAMSSSLISRGSGSQTLNLTTSVSKPKLRYWSRSHSATRRLASVPALCGSLVRRRKLASGPRRVGNAAESLFELAFNLRMRG